jgi:hypothetical protein
MGKRRFHKVTVTKRNFRLALVALGVLAVWLIALSALIPTSTDASAEKSFGATHSLAKKTGAKMGAAPGSAHIDNSNGAVGVKDGVWTPTNDRPGSCTGEFYPCSGLDKLADSESFNEHGSGISFAGGGRSSSDANVNQQIAGSSGREVPDEIFGNGGTTAVGQYISPQNGPVSPGSADAGIGNALIGAADPFPRSKDGTPNDDPQSFVTISSPGTPNDLDPQNIAEDDPSLANAPATFPAGTPQPVPEPWTLSIFAVGLFAAMGRRRVAAAC